MKTKINHWLYILFMIVLPTACYSWQIVEPRGNTVQKCQSINICWEYFASSTDQYTINLYYKPTSYYVANNKVTLGETLQYSWVNVEDWAWGDVSRCIGDITISKNWSTDGEIRIEVIAQDEEFNVWGANTFETQAITEKIYAIDGPELARPASQSISQCGPQSRKISVNPKNAANRIKWYTSLRGGTAVYEGNEKTDYYEPGFKVWYVCEATRSGDCAFESLRSPISIMTFPNNTAALPLEKVSIYPEPDARLQEPSCSRAGTYYEFNDNISVNATIPPVNLLGVSFYSKSNFSTWNDAQYYSRIGTRDRVCNSNLPVGLGTSRTYTRDFTMSANWVISDPITGENLLSGSGSCTMPNMRSVEVSKARDCNPTLVTDIQKIYKNNTDCTNDPDKVIICPVETALSIGPNSVIHDDTGGKAPLKYPKTTHTFSWTSDQPGNDGLGNKNARNQIISYNNISLPKGYLYIKYTCTITKTIVLDPTTTAPVVTTQKYCVIVYKCPDCPDGNRPAMEEEEEEVNNHSLGIHPSLSSKQIALKLFPNPAHTELTISFEHEQHSDDAYVSITDLRGHLIDQFPLKTDHGSETINISNIKNGTYIANLYIEGQKKGSQLLLINH